MTIAHYFDGRTARMHPVDIGAGGGVIVLSGAVDKVYPATDATIAEPFAHAPLVLYFPDGACCEVPDPAAGHALAAALGYRKSRVVRWQERTWAALLALVLLVLLIAATAIWGVPAAAERIAAALPAGADQALGRTALAALESHGLLAPSRLSDQRLAEVEQVLRQIAPARPRLPLRVLVRDSAQLGPNALALPDGSIVVTDRMIREILSKEGDSDDQHKAQLAGVLAHEIGHVELRHSARSLARSSLTAAAAAALFGDFSAVAAGVPALLVKMRYSRAMEAEADDYAIALLRSHGISPAPLADLFDALDSAPGVSRGLPDWMVKSTEYMATHPSSAQRSAHLRAAAR
ncbi:MAG: M48 family metallopeptidase [Massilia sp.]